MSRRLFVVTPEARADLIEIWNYIAEDSVDGADKVLARIYDAFARLGQTPGMGHHREDLADPRTASGRFTPTHRVSLGKDAATDHRRRPRRAAVGGFLSAADSVTSKAAHADTLPRAGFVEGKKRDQTSERPCQ